MKQCGCRFCIQALASEQRDFPVVHGTRDGGHGAKQRTDGNVPDQHRGAGARLSAAPPCYVVDRCFRKPFATRLQD
jgi:hypothetical protein